MKHYTMRFVDGSTHVVRNVHQHTVADGLMYLWGPVTGGKAKELGGWVLASLRGWTVEELQ